MTTTLDPNLLTAMADLKTAFWKAVHEQRHFDSLDRARELKAVCESFRRLHAPETREVFVTCDREIGQPLTVLAWDAQGDAVVLFEERS
ncbi:MAG: hypothetical protein J7518_22450 [Nocardioidaceae bacterium]|nr:hypothetical protein [Nocardioidaceae bacterium]